MLRGGFQFRKKDLGVGEILLEGKGVWGVSCGGLGRNLMMLGLWIHEKAFFHFPLSALQKAFLPFLSRGRKRDDGEK
jgi:hypothetical protein